MIEKNSKNAIRRELTKIINLPIDFDDEWFQGCNKSFFLFPSAQNSYTYYIYE